MDLEDELRRVLREERLRVPVRTGAEWRMLGDVRRRRQRSTTMATASGLAAVTALVGGGIAVAAYQEPEPAAPAGPIVGDMPTRGGAATPPNSPDWPGLPGRDVQRASTSEPPRSVLESQPMPETLAPVPRGSLSWPVPAGGVPSVLEGPASTRLASSSTAPPSSEPAPGPPSSSAGTPSSGGAPESPTPGM